MSLKKKLIVVILLFITIPMGILGMFSYVSFSNSMQSVVEKQLTTEGEQTGKYFDKCIDSVDKYIQVLSSDEKIIKYAGGVTDNSAEMIDYLKSLQTKNSDNIETLAITDANGKEILNSQKGKVNIDLINHDYVQSALMGYSSISDVIRSTATGKTIIAIAYPLKIGDKVVGSIIGSIDFNNICKDVSKIQVAQKGYAYILNDRGLVVYHPDQKKVLKFKVGDFKSSDLTALYNKAKNKRKVMGYYTIDGVKKYAIFIPVDRWIVILTVECSDYMSVVIMIERVILIIVIISAACAIILAYFIVKRNIIKPIENLKKVISKAGDGDFSVRVEINTGDEMQVLGEHFNKMLEQQSDMISNISEYSKELAATSSELSASNGEINYAIEEVSCSIQKIAESAKTQDDLITESTKMFNQLSYLVNDTQLNAYTAKQSSENSIIAANKGRKEVEKTVEAIRNINKASEEAENNLIILNELSKKVNGIITTINAISTQTNLLALNAAIEAARAGEHGKGFTVVAEEVRKLSVETNKEANKISKVISEMDLLLGKAVDSMRENKRVVGEGVEIVSNTDKSFISIIETIDKIGEDIDKIVTGTKDEVNSSEKIAKIIENIASYIKNTTINTHEVAGAAEEQTAIAENVANHSEMVSEMAVNMHGLIEKYNI